jgi:hypothetical protein
MSKSPVIEVGGGGVSQGTNLLFNGDFSVNQRGGTRTPGIGVYGFDRWKGHASGLEQIVEGLGLLAGDVILSWVGGGVGSIDGGGAAASPVTGVAISETNLSVVVPSDATFVQLEYGDATTPFQYVNPREQLANCQRYYWQGVPPGASFDYLYATAGDNNMCFVNFSFPVTMRIQPIVAIVIAPPAAAVILLE